MFKRNIWILSNWHISAGSLTRIAGNITSKYLFLDPNVLLIHVIYFLSACKMFVLLSYPIIEYFPNPDVSRRLTSYFNVHFPSRRIPPPPYLGDIYMVEGILMSISHFWHLPPSIYRVWEVKKKFLTWAGPTLDI